ncbi:MAG: AbrB/MazE/SpoVT family DNA-binding domain-containing protein [Patescibacteria group bacterium]|nr:AbrB/MazE/SpoVT family DNA-binding domain-containing protein [Patescibacteria group bacterium]
MYFIILSENLPQLPLAVMVFCDICFQIFEIINDVTQLQASDPGLKYSLSTSYQYVVLKITLEKLRSRTYNDTNYFRYRITIPIQIVREFKLEGGQILDVSVTNDAIVIKKIPDE